MEPIVHLVGNMIVQAINDVKNPSRETNYKDRMSAIEFLDSDLASEVLYLLGTSCEINLDDIVE